MGIGKACASCLGVNVLYEVMDLGVCKSEVESQDCWCGEAGGLRGGVCELNLPWGRWNLPIHVQKN